MRRFLFSCSAIVCAVAIACGVRASEVSVTLDLQFNTPGNTNSGGTWTAVAKADERGLAGIRLAISDGNFNPNSGFLAPASFEVQRAFPNVLFLDIIAGDDLVDPVLDVGVIGSWPTNYPNDDGLVPLAGNPDLGSFAGGVALATGSFDPGDISSWFDDGTGFTDATLFIGGSTTIERASSILLTIRAPDPTTPVLVDIKPGSFPNSVNLNSKGVLPVAILGTNEFDVTEVNIATLLFGDPNSGTPLFPVRSAIEDVSDDGFEDLSLKFSVADLVESGALGFDTIEGLLTGELFDGTSFEGMDAIRIVPPSFSSAPLIAAVPEPTTSALALAALCLVTSRRQFRR